MRAGCVLCWMLAAALASACDDDAGLTPPRAVQDAGPARVRAEVAFRFASPSWHVGSAELDAGSTPAHEDAGAPVDPVVARGEYLVRHVSGCMDCHTPRLLSGRFDESHLLSGIENLADVEPDDPARGALHSRNLTPDERTGLGRWSDAEIKRAFQRGIDDYSTVLHWTMPYWIYANMSDADADAIVAYLRAIPAVEHDVPRDQPNAVDLRQPYEPYELELDALPDTTLAQDAAEHASARRGRYVATALSPCLLCHTPPHPSDLTQPIDVARAFSGRRVFLPIPLGWSGELDPRVQPIESHNLTPHATGIAAWSAENVANALTLGMGPELPLCDPMPSTNAGDSFRGMTHDDALDLGRFFTTLPPQDSGEIADCCTGCHHDDADGGSTFP